VAVRRPLGQQLAGLAADTRAGSSADHSSCFTLTLASGAGHRVQEVVAITAC
jgi:hypothetical protein